MIAVVDRFSKYAVLMVALDNCIVEIVVDLFHRNVVKYFGVPNDIASDRDARLTGWLWTHLLNLLGSELKFSSANHPQIDGHIDLDQCTIGSVFKVLCICRS